MDEEIVKSFAENVANDSDFHERLARFCAWSRRRFLLDDPDRLELVSELRLRLAEMSVDMLEPDLIILDEFQRFKNLLDHKNPDARLAHRLFRYPNVKTLLLSATPYKMLSLDHEQEDDHYPDFLNTLQFLFGSDGEVEDTKREIQSFRQALYSLGSGDIDHVGATRDRLQARLSRVICRTERVDSARSQDAMLHENRKMILLQPSDLHQAVLAGRVAASVGARDIIEYWKSSPYLVNFLRRYEFRKRLEKHYKNPSEELLERLSLDRKRLLRRADIKSYREVDPANPRLRDLLSQTIEKGLWKLLWMPPSMPYTKPEGPYSDIGDVTKALVFSSWNVVPDAIASLCSYDAERRMLGELSRKVKHDNLNKAVRPLLRFPRGPRGRLTGMSVLILLYPCATFASIVDPLEMALEHEGPGLIPSEGLLKKAEVLIRPHVTKWLKKAPDNGPEDRRWYWAIPALLDAARFPPLRHWLTDEENGWPSIGVDGSDERGEQFMDHLELLQGAMDNTLDRPLGRPPADLMRVLAMLAVAGPGVSALRALRRIAPSLSWNDPSMLYGAVRISDGFRTLFNLSETIALLRGSEPESSYWRLVLRYCLEGNIQSLLDEQVHCLVESLGVFDESEEKRAKDIGDSIGLALSMRTSQLQLDEIVVNRRRRRIKIKGYNTRCRFALRFSELKDEEGSTLVRADTVRDAFNSPFRPFVLASTSIGQEGLDFHTWCHTVVHWNLPRNPVDLEQREGRVNRYKGHAIRKNVAKSYGLDALRKEWDREDDPWNFMFELAKKDRASDASDLVPYFLFEIEGGARIERRVPMLPFSREEQHFHTLKRMLAIYRLVFGQPRQEDLLAYLASNMDSSVAESALDMWRISLEPPNE